MRQILAGAVAVFFLASVPAGAATIDSTGLLSRSTGGGIPNGPSRDPAAMSRWTFCGS